MLGTPLKLVACLAAATALLAVPAQGAAPDEWLRWKADTPELANTWIRSLDFNGASVFAGGEYNGVFTAPGSSVAPWSQVNGGLAGATAQSVRQVKVGPDGLLYASTSAGLFRSSPPGGSWQPVGQGAGTRKLNMGGVQGVVFPSPSPTDIVAAVAGAGGAGVYYSSDGGASWDRAAGMPTPTSVYQVVAPVSGTPMYAAADGGVWISLDFGRSWVAYSDGIPPGETTLRVAFPPQDPTHLYASTSGGVYKFDKAKLVWEEVAGTDGQTLPAAGGKRAFFLTPPLNGQFGTTRGVVGTDQGVWGTIDDGAHWGQMSTETFPDPNIDPAPDPDMNKVVWALNLGFTQPTLLAGVQGFGVFTILLQPVETGTVTIGPVSSLNAGDELTHSKTGFGGTKPIFFKYQWRRCEGAGCTPSTAIPGATGPSYVIPKDDAGKRVRYSLLVEARNLVHPQFVSDVSNITADADVAASPGDTPRPSFLFAEQPKLTPTASQDWGTAYTISNGRWRTEASDTTITNQVAFSYQWRRCKGVDCETIAGATGPTYTATPEDIAYTIEAYVRGTRNAVSSQYYLAGIASKVKNKFPVNTALPQILGTPYVGQTLSSNSGGWDGFDMRFERRWLRCEADGLGCNVTSPVNTTSTYALTAADRGKRLVLEVTAIAEDESQDRATKVQSAATPVITDPPVTAGPAPSPPGTSTPTPTPNPKPTIKIVKPKVVKPGAKLRVPAKFAGFRSAKYRWLRNGKKIKGATKRIYKIKRKDRGKKIACRVTLIPAAGGPAVVVKTTPVKVPKPRRRRG